MCCHEYFAVLFIGEVGDIVALKALEPEASELKIDGNELDLVGRAVHPC